MSAHLQQQYQQRGFIDPLGPLADWLQAAWYDDVLGSGGLSQGATVTDIAAAMAHAKSAPADAAMPNRLALQVMERLLLQLYSGLAVRSHLVVGSPQGIVCEVLQQLQQGLAEGQRAIVAVEAMGSHGSAANYRPVLLTCVLSQAVAWGGARQVLVQGIVMRLMGQL
jgi:hypothetical protein